MAIELSKEAKKEAVASIVRYFQQNMEERIGNLAAGALLGFFVEEIDIEVHEDEFQYWRKYERQAKSK